jgi:hypothetical protein
MGLTCTNKTQGIARDHKALGSFKFKGLLFEGYISMITDQQCGPKMSVHFAFQSNTSYVTCFLR